MATPIITVDDIVVTEGSSTATFTLRLSETSLSNVSVTASTSNGTASTGFDYSGTSQVITWTPGQTVKTLQVNLLNDGTLEGLENFSLNLSGAVGGIIGGDGFAWATIVDNDAPAGTPNIRVSDAIVDEASGRVSFFVTLDKPSTSAVSVNYATANGTALAGTDYAATSGSLVFAAGETAKTVIVNLVNDSTAESDEHFTLRLSSAVGGTIRDGTGAAIIGRNDSVGVAAPIVTVSDVAVGESDTHAEFVVRLGSASASVVTVSYTTGNLSASTGFDYSGFSGSLRFEAGETTKVLKVPVLSDSSLEGIESFGLVLTSATNATVGRALATATIIDNDAVAGTPAVRLGDAVVDEKAGLAYVPVFLDKPSTGNVSVTFSTAAISATDAADYQNLTASPLVFSPGETVKTVVIALSDDSTAEGLEILDVSISAVTGGTIGDPRGHIFIHHNDSANVASPVITLSNAVTVEGEGYVDFHVRLSAPSASNVSVNYTTVNGTASSGFDYVATSGTLVFGAGETVRTIRIVTHNDANIEIAPETFTLNLSAAVNATLGTASASATIVDDDAAPPAAPLPLGGNALADLLRGTKFADAISGGNGDDLIDGLEGNDSMDGGAGNDTYIVEQTGDVVTEGAAGGNDVVISYVNYTLSTNVEELNLFGSALSGTGNAGNNILRGNAGANTLDGKAGADTMIGGAGNDTYVVDVNADVVTELASAGIDTVRSSVTYTLGANVENLTLQTGAGILDGTGNSLDNVIMGNNSDNVLNGAGGIDTVSYANATNFVTVSLATAALQNTNSAGFDALLNFENLTGSAFADALFGDAGDNVIDGGLGVDTMSGGAGNDTYVIDSLSDVIVESAGGGSDTVRTGGSYTLAAGSNLENITLSGTSAVNATGDAGDNVLTGNSAANTLTGLDGNDRLDGGSGNDTMVGGLGNDTYVVGSTGDVVTEIAGQGTDTIESSITYTLGTTLENLTLLGTSTLSGTGNAENNIIQGNSAANTLSGLDGHDTLSGNNGNDTLLGGIGDDRLIGGAGNDTLTGGTGLDKFVFNSALSASGNVDTVTDLVLGQDLLVLSRSVFSGLIGNNVPLDAAAFFSGAGATSAADGSDRVIYNTTNGFIYYDADGVGGSASVLFAKLSTPQALSAGNFLVEL